MKPADDIYAFLYFSLRLQLDFPSTYFDWWISEICLVHVCPRRWWLWFFKKEKNEEEISDCFQINIEKWWFVVWCCVIMCACNPHFLFPWDQLRRDFSFREEIVSVWLGWRIFSLFFPLANVTFSDTQVHARKE